MSNLIFTLTLGLFLGGVLGFRLARNTTDYEEMRLPSSYRNDG